MQRFNTPQLQLVILVAALCIALAPVANHLHAQTPEASDLPPPDSGQQIVDPNAQDPTLEEDPAPPAPADEPPPADDSAPPANDLPPPADDSPPPLTDDSAPPADDPPPSDDSDLPLAEDPPPPSANDPVPLSADDPVDQSEDDPIIEDPTEEATDEPASEAIEESIVEATEEPTAEATKEAEADDEGTPAAEIDRESDEDSTPATPTPTEEPALPDELQVVGDVDIAIAPGEHKDVVVRYTIGSDREKTEMSANLTAPGGESLDDWSLVPWQRADLDEDTNDTNRHLKARIDYADNVENGDVYETTWRVTAPDHIEKPVTVRLHISTKIHSEDGATEGVIRNDLVTVNATASVHSPTFICHEVIAEDVENTWNCAFDTTHPDDDVVITASAEVPEGWELTLDDDELNSDLLAISAEAVAAGNFTLAATYPIGCPDIDATFSSSVSLSMTYPSGEVADLDAELPLVFERPTPSFEITSFEFDEMDLRETLSTTGQITISYDELPCTWQATLQLTDLESEMFTIPSDLIRISSVEGLPDATVGIVDGTISIIAAELTDDDVGGEFTIHFAIDLPHQIPSGAYRIEVSTQFSWADQN